MTEKLAFEDAVVRITLLDNTTRAIFDVSRTIECLWIAVSNVDWPTLEVIGSTRKMLKYVAHNQVDGAKVSDDDNWLNKQAQDEGCEDWAEYVREECDQPEWVP